MGSLTDSRSGFTGLGDRWLDRTNSASWQLVEGQHSRWCVMLPRDDKHLAQRKRPFSVLATHNLPRPVATLGK